MRETHTKFSFPWVEELAAAGETNRVEFKNSTYLVLDHSGNQNKRCVCKRPKPIKDKTALRDECRRMLGKECGAFANSDGGVLLIGYEDDGLPDTELIPLFYNESNTKMEDWVSDLLRSSLEPPLENFECRSVLMPGGGVVVAIDVKRSEKAPHQSQADQSYYVRAEKSSIRAGHWIIEMIRNRRVYPRLSVSLALDHSEVRATHRSESTSQRKAAIRLAFRVENLGSAMARDWAIDFRCPFVRMNVLPQPAIEQVGLSTEDPNTARMVQGRIPVFPSQALTLLIDVDAPVHLDDRRGKINHFHWEGLPEDRFALFQPSEEKRATRAFSFDLTVYADSAPPIHLPVAVSEADFFPKMLEYVQRRDKPRSLFDD